MECDARKIVLTNKNCTTAVAATATTTATTTKQNVRSLVYRYVTKIEEEFRALIFSTAGSLVLGRIPFAKNVGEVDLFLGQGPNGLQGGLEIV